MRTQNKETQDHLTPDSALRILQDGNVRFISNLKLNRNLLQQVNDTQAGQWPFACVLSCIDSRTSAELIFDQGLGDIFSVRIAGNILNEDILGSMEFACKVAGSKLIMVLGHTKCGAIKGACAGVKMGNLTSLLGKIEPIVARQRKVYCPDGESNDVLVEMVAQANIREVMKAIPLRSPILAEMLEKNEIKIAGGVYNVETGVVDFFDAPTFPADPFPDEESRLLAGAVA
jgi:carbonic anhydrase